MAITKAWRQRGHRSTQKLSLHTYGWAIRTTRRGLDAAECVASAWRQCRCYLLLFWNNVLSNLARLQRLSGTSCGRNIRVDMQPVARSGMTHFVNECACARLVILKPNCSRKHNALAADFGYHPCHHCKQVIKAPVRQHSGRCAAENSIRIPKHRMQMIALSQNKESTFLWKGLFAQFLAISFRSRVDRSSNLRLLHHMELSLMRLAAGKSLLQPSFPFGS